MRAGEHMDALALFWAMLQQGARPECLWHFDSMAELYGMTRRRRALQLSRRHAWLRREAVQGGVARRR